MAPSIEATRPRVATAESRTWAVGCRRRPALPRRPRAAPPRKQPPPAPPLISGALLAHTGASCRCASCDSPLVRSGCPRLRGHHAPVGVRVPRAHPGG